MTAATTLVLTIATTAPSDPLLAFTTSDEHTLSDQNILGIQFEASLSHALSGYPAMRDFAQLTLHNVFPAPW